MDITGPQGVPYFKVIFNSNYKHDFIEFKFFIVPLEYAENSITDFIENLHVYLTGPT